MQKFVKVFYTKSDEHKIKLGKVQAMCNYNKLSFISPCHRDKKNDNCILTGFLTQRWPSPAQSPVYHKYPAGLFERRRIPLLAVLRKRTCNNNEFYPF